MKEIYKSNNSLIWLTLGFIGVTYWAGDMLTKSLHENLIAASLCGFLLLIVYHSSETEHLEIENEKILVNSGYDWFRKQRLNINDIKYIYRKPQFIIKWYGSRMMIITKDSTGKLTESDLREVNFSEGTLIRFLKRIKELNPKIELDPEYEMMLKGELFKNDPSENTTESIEKRLRDKGEKW